MSRFTTVQIEPQILIADRPVEAGTSDLFKHQQLADQIVEGIRSSENSQIHAISGRYGSGKTSVGYFTQSKLDDTGFDVVRLRALELNDEGVQDSLIQTIHERLGLREQRTRIKRTETAEWLRQLQFNALPFSLGFVIVAVVAFMNTFSLGQALLQGLYGGLALVIMLSLSSLVRRNPQAPQASPDSYTITTICVRDILKRTRQRPVVVLVEDLDRLPGTDILAALEGFQRLTSTPGSVLHVVVELDETAVRHALGQVLRDEERPYHNARVAAEEYMSKLITYRHRIPQQAHADLLQFCEIKLAAAAHPYLDVLTNAEDKPLEVLVPPSVKTPREAIQLLNTFSEDYSLAMKRNLTALIESPAILARVTTLKQLYPEFYAAMLDDHRLLEVADELLTLGRNEAIIDEATLRALPEETLESFEALELLKIHDGESRLPASALYSYLSYSLQKAPVKDVRLYPFLYLEEPPKEEREQEVLRLVRSGKVAALRVSLGSYNDRRNLVEVLLKIFREAPKRSERNGAMKALIELYDVLQVRLDYRYNQQIAREVSSWLTEERIKELNLDEVIGLIEGLPQGERAPLIRRLREVFNDNEFTGFAGALLNVLVTRDARRAVDHVFVSNITQRIRERIPLMSAKEVVALVQRMRHGHEPESVAAQVFWTQAPLLSQLIDHVYRVEDREVFREMPFEDFAEGVRENADLLWGAGPQQMSDFIELLFQAPSWDAYSLAAGLLKGHVKDVPSRSVSAMTRSAFAVLVEEKPEASDVSWLVSEAAPLLGRNKDEVLTKRISESLIATWQAGDDEMQQVMLNIMSSLDHNLPADHPALEAIHEIALDLPEPQVLPPRGWQNWELARPRQQLEVLFDVAAQNQEMEFAAFFKEQIADAEPLLSLPIKLRGSEAKRRALPLVLELNQFMGFHFQNEHLSAYLDIALQVEEPLAVATLLSQSPLTEEQKTSLCDFLDQLVPSAEADRLRVGLECRPSDDTPAAEQAAFPPFMEMAEAGEPISVLPEAAVAETPSETHGDTVETDAADISEESVDASAMATIELSAEEVEAEIARLEALEEERKQGDEVSSQVSDSADDAEELIIQEAKTVKDEEGFSFDLNLAEDIGEPVDNSQTDDDEKASKGDGLEGF